MEVEHKLITDYISSPILSDIRKTNVERKYDQASKLKQCHHVTPADRYEVHYNLEQ